MIKSFMFSKVKSAGKLIEEAVTLQAYFGSCITSLAILRVNLHTIGLGLEVVFLMGMQCAISISWIEDVYWTGEKTRKATSSNVASQISSLRDHTGQKCVNEDEEADADDPASEVETDRTRQKIRRGLAKFRRRLQERVQLLLS